MNPQSNNFDKQIKSNISLNDSHQGSGNGLAEEKTLLETELKTQINEVYHLPSLHLILKASDIHRKHHEPGEIQKSTLISLKSGRCPEDCKYCSQSAHYKTGLENTELMDKQQVLSQARLAKKSGTSRFCMGLSGTRIKDGELFEGVLEIVKQVKNMGLETCLTMGMVEPHQANKLKEAGLDFYNHNLDTSRDHYKKIVTTRTYDERLETIQNIRDANIKVCTGGILGMGENRKDRIDFIHQLASITPKPESLTVNRLVPIKGTPLGEMAEIDPWEIIRTIATLRIFCPKSAIRLSAGREKLSTEIQALCFLAGANSVFSGDELLTTSNQTLSEDKKMFEKIGLKVRPN